MENNQIQFRAEFIIENGKIEEYKKLIQEMSRVVEVNELNTIVFQFYLEGSGTKCVVHEVYTNSEAVFVHIASQTILPKIFRVAWISRFEVYGNPSEKLQKMITNYNPHIYNLIAGFSR
jgi:quinol monooxygenase YgiN